MAPKLSVGEVATGVKNLRYHSHQSSAAANRKASFEGTIRLILAAFVVLWLNAGTATFVTNSIPLVAKVMVFFCWAVLATGRSQLFRRSIMRLWPILAFFAIVLAALLGGSAEPLVPLYAQRISFLLVVVAVFLFYTIDGTRQERRILGSLLLLDLIIVAARTIVALEREPLLSRYLASSVENRLQAYGQSIFPGIADFGHIYSAAVMVPVLYFSIFKIRKWKFIPLSILGIFSALLIEAAFTTALLLAISGVFLASLILLSEKTSWFVSLPLVVLMSVAGYQLLIKGLPLLAASQTLPFDVSVRILEIESMLVGRRVGGDLGARADLFIRSVDAFLAHPLIGTAFAPGSRMMPGGHAEVLDLLATFGLLSVFFIIGLWVLFRITVQHGSFQARPIIKQAWVIVAALSLVNPVLFSNISTVWLLCVPWIIEVLNHDHKDDQRNESPLDNQCYAT